jgi:hypothetical protein
MRKNTVGSLVFGILALASAQRAGAQPLPAPQNFVRWLDLECHRPDTLAQSQGLNRQVRLTQLNPALSFVPDHSVFVRNLEELCVPVRNNEVQPPADVLPFERFADFACYKVETTFALNRQMSLRHLNPVLHQLRPRFPDERVLVEDARQLCVPVAKGPVTAIPTPVRTLIENIDLECFAIQSDPAAVTLANPLLLSHLNPLLANFPASRPLNFRPQQLCLPVAKDGVLPPAAILEIVRQVDLKKYQIAPTGPTLNVNFSLSQLNPLFANTPPVPISTLTPERLALPIRKMTVGINKDLRNTTGRPANDIEILVQGSQPVIFHYDGYPAH